MNKENIKPSAVPAAGNPILSQSIVVSGRRYVSLAEAGARFGYTERHISYLAKTHQVRMVRGYRTYVEVSRLGEIIRRRPLTKIQAMANWWTSHPGKHQAITTWKDLKRCLSRDGIYASPSHIRTFLQKVRTLPDSISHQIADWIESDPSRIDLSHDETRRRFNADQGMQCTRRQIKRGRALFYKRHGKPSEPNPDHWIRGSQAAADIGITSSMINLWCDRGRLVYQTVNHKRYVHRGSLKRWLAQWQPRNNVKSVTCPEVTE